MKQTNTHRNFSSRTISNVVIWIKYISWLYYSNEMAMINQWRDVTYLECNQPANMTCISNGLEIIAYYGFNIVRKIVFFVSIENKRK